RGRRLGAAVDAFAVSSVAGRGPLTRLGRTVGYARRSQRTGAGRRRGWVDQSHEGAITMTRRVLLVIALTAGTVLSAGACGTRTAASGGADHVAAPTPAVTDSSGASTPTSA